MNKSAGAIAVDAACIDLAALGMPFIALCSEGRVHILVEADMLNGIASKGGSNPMPLGFRATKVKGGYTEYTSIYPIMDWQPHVFETWEHVDPSYQQLYYWMWYLSSHAVEVEEQRDEYASVVNVHHKRPGYKAKAKASRKALYIQTTARYAKEA